MKRIDLYNLPSPSYVIDEVAVENNARILKHVQKQSGAKILLAMKGFATWSLFPMLSEYLAGTCASGLHEAMLGHEKFGRENHVYAPAFGDAEFEELLQLADHISFNSFNQWRHFRSRILVADRPISCGIRINPEHSEVKTKLYDPCAPASRLGVTLRAFEKNVKDLEGIEGLHFHTLCELNADALERTLAVVEEKFSQYIPQMKWINFGGGHHITRVDYDVERLINLIRDFKSRYKVEVYLEPGEAIGLNTGVLVASVLDIIHNDMDIAILDTSATAHMPDVLEMPYRPRIIGVGHDPLPGGQPGDKNLPHAYRLGGLTCLAGDVIGDYSFPRHLRIGDRLVFDDMAHYTMVKNTTFNGVPLPSIVIHNSSTGDWRVVRTFGYDDYKNRLS